MDLRNNHMVADLDAVEPELRRNYTPVPPHLAEQARRELAGRESAYISPDHQSALAKWAARKLKKQRAKAKIGKASRKRNR